MIMDTQRWSGSNNPHPLNDVMDGLNEAVDMLQDKKQDMDFAYDDELQLISRRVAIIMVAMGLNPDLNEGS